MISLSFILHICNIVMVIPILLRHLKIYISVYYTVTINMQVLKNIETMT